MFQAAAARARAGWLESLGGYKGEAGPLKEDWIHGFQLPGGLDLGFVDFSYLAARIMDFSCLPAWRAAWLLCCWALLSGLAAALLLWIGDLEVLQAAMGWV